MIKETILVGGPIKPEVLEWMIEKIKALPFKTHIAQRPVRDENGDILKPMKIEVECSTEELKRLQELLRTGKDPGS